MDDIVKLINPGLKYKLKSCPNRRVQVFKAEDQKGDRSSWFLKFTRYDRVEGKRKRDCIEVTKIALSGEAMMATVMMVMQIEGTGEKS